MRWGLLPRVALILAVGVVSWVVACNLAPTECESNFTKCPTDDTFICCKDGCDGPKCVGERTDPLSRSGATDPQCVNEQLPTRTKYCDGKCIDPTSDSKNCGSCKNVCGRDTNDVPLFCHDSECK